MSYDDLGRVEYLPFAELVELIKNRQLDATLQSAGLGVASIRDLATSVPINVVAVPPEIVAAIGAPFLAATIPAGTYDGQAGGRGDGGGRQLPRHQRRRAGRDRLPMTKLLFENLDQLAAAHAAAKAIDPAKALDGMPLPAASRRRALLPRGGHPEVAWRARTSPRAASRSRACPPGFGEGRAGQVAFGIAVAFSAFQLWTAAYGNLPSQVVRAMHVGFLLLLGFALIANLAARSRGRPGVVLAPRRPRLRAPGVYNWVFYADLIRRSRAS